MKNKIVLAGLFSGLFSGLFCYALQAQAVVLITGSEAQLPAAAGVLKTRGITRGPGIKLISPDTGASVKSPFNLKIDFETRGGVKIDPASVKVTYLKSPAVDLTSRLAGGVSPDGIVLNKAEAPPGDHQLSVKVKDVDGRESNTIVDFKVSP